MERIIPYGRQFIDEDDTLAVSEALQSDFITQGPRVAEFERVLAGYCGSRHAVVFNSGTSALHGAYFAAGLSQGDELITSPNTFAATANAGIYLGARPVFVDIEPDTGNIDASLIEEKITGKTRMLVPVHYAGHPCDMERIGSLARERGLTVIEDACHALGAEYKGKTIGGCHYSDMTVFSFHPVKNITTGEGGAVLTNSEEHYKRLVLFRSHGITREHCQHEPHGEWYYEMQLLGYNYRMTDIQAALGISQMKKLDRFIGRRREIATIYSQTFADHPSFDCPVEWEYARSAYHLYPLRLRDKERKREIFHAMRQSGLGVQVHYIPVYRHPYYESLGYEKGLCPNAEDFYGREISIPLFPAMTEQDMKSVIMRIEEIFRERP